jgi:uncharacterized protein YbaR (Trm112 family)
MDEHGLEGNYGRQVVIDLCYPCRSIWFDGLELLQLAPGSTLRLLALVHEHRGEERPLPAGPGRCPRCRQPLAPTADAQRGTRFHYARCPADHGRFITFFEFLRAKNFVRPLSAGELAQLRQRLQVVACSSCGAPVDIDRGAACPYCRAPLSMLDAGQLERTVGELWAAEARRQTVDPQLATRLVLDRLAVERSLAPTETPGGARGHGLLDAGLDALLEALRLRPA